MGSGGNSEYVAYPQIISTELLVTVKDLPGDYPKGEYTQHVGPRDFSVKGISPSSRMVGTLTSSGAIVISNETQFVRLRHPDYLEYNPGQ
jgi:hypothetical protein